MTAADEAKQLDSVTDMFHEKVAMDESKAKDAMTALGGTTSSSSAVGGSSSEIKVSKEDVEVIVSEMEVSEDVAVRVLREVVVEEGLEVTTGNSVVAAALRKLISS